MKYTIWLISLIIGLTTGYFVGKSSVDCEYELYKQQKVQIENSQSAPVVEKVRNYTNDDRAVTSTNEVPEKAIKVLQHIRKHGTAPEGVQGGRKFFNREKLLPLDEEYQEWDIHVKVRGKNRGAERIVTFETKAYYTPDHYRSFILIKEK